MNKTIKLNGIFSSLPAALLRLEGAAVFISAIFLYFIQGASGLWFVVLVFAPDLSMVGYLINPRVGSFMYNAFHTYALPTALIAMAFAARWTPGIHLALIWFTHIGMDRMLGYGLKYPTAFKDTHLQRI